LSSASQLPALRGERLKLPSRPAVKKKNFVCAVAGRKGSGKSEVVRDIGERTPRWFHFDTMAEHIWIPDRFDSVEDASWYLLDTAATREKFQGAFMASGEDLESDFGLISDSVFDAGNLTFCVEEIPMMSTPGHLPKKFDRIVRTGRHRNVSVVYTCQRLSECARRLTAATDLFILFHHSEPLDLSAISERCGSEIAVAVSRLGEHDFLMWDVTQRKTIAHQELVSVVLPKFHS
jgi:hypothetical protein